MKKLLLILFTVSLVVSCEKKEKPKDYLVLSGEVDNLRKRTIELTGHNFEKKIRFDRKTKTFLDTLTNITPGHYVLKIGKRPVQVYLSSIDDLKLIVDAKKRTKDPVFQGPTANINNYITEKAKKIGIVLGNASKLFSMNEEEFLSKLDEYKSILEDLAKSSQLPQDYLDKEMRNIHYEFALALENYQNYHRILYGDDEFVVSNQFPSDIPKDVDLNNSGDYINSKPYRDLIKKRLDEVTNKKNRTDGDFDLSYLESVHTEINDTLIKNDLLHKAAEKQITTTINLKEYFRKYNSYSTNAKNKAEISDLYNKLKLTAKGQPSPKFEKLENYNGGKTSLDDLIGKGKYVYIDVWATWCGFCKKEIPLLKRFEQQFHDKNIEFVSLSVDRPASKEKWKQTIKDREMSGIQLFAGKTQEELQFTKDYLIKGLPRFILIDPDGKIVNANAPRPSRSEELIKLFEELDI
ncbi:TlpA family protein disulfide reductase [Tenacibaculum jejuense]|uniref:Thioredoxin domain-containing protein n=1 Tax=Tenacibaculum jejuense TaxID=584609 RepID=A0A238UCS0_9FLAO|nr:TlpA disulfide reductase family protein [Tenacibaculum jejuense]SNR16971.1 conserved protein of unknown function [Tenacibaculum jejuense]